MEMDGLTVAWGLIPWGVPSGKRVPFGPFCLFFWKESYAFLDGSPGERTYTPDVFTGQGSTQFLRREGSFV